jgi:serine/threonine-protein kinase
MTSAGEGLRAAWPEILGASEVLRHLSEDRRRELIDASEMRHFAQGAELTRAGMTPEAAMLIATGVVEAQSVDSRYTIEAPAIVEDVSALADLPAISTVRALCPVDAVVISRDRLRDALRTSNAAGQALTEAVADRLSATDAGQLAGRFFVDGVIGEGGSGRVLRARHGLLGTPVALKMLSHALALSPGGARAFIREASVLVHLDHPGIVRVLDVFAAHGTFFIVMPWLEGSTLRDYVDANVEFSPGQVLELGGEMLDALIVLHATGLVHRDVKPSNVLLKASGRMVLIDFGIACQRDRPASQRQLVGSPSYCSPEQILGRPVDGRSDVYSLGCTLYEIVFGEPPFVGDDIDSVVEGHLRGTPSFDRTPKVPMDAVFLRWLRGCLSRTRAQRPDAAQARAQLSYLIPSTIDERTAPRARVTVPVPLFLMTGEYSTNP